MAKSISKAPKKAPKVKMGKTVVASMNRKAYGDEYEFSAPVTPKEASTAFNWYSLNCDGNLAKRFLTDYLKDSGQKELLDRVKKISEQRVLGFASTSCWIARMLSNGTVFIDRELADKFFNDGIENLLAADDRATAEANVVVTKPKRKPSLIRSPMEKKFDRYLEILNMIADALNLEEVGKFNPKFMLLPIIKDEGLLVDHAKDMLVEVDYMGLSIQEELDDPDTERSRSTLLRKKQSLLASVILDIHSYIKSLTGSKKKETKDGEPKVRKPRKKKPVSAEKLVSRMKFQAEDKDLDLRSIAPVKIIGAQELWVYNTKYCSLTVYRATNTDGLSVKGTTILNFDEDRSISKKIGRTAKKVTADVMSGGKVQLRKMMDVIKSTPTKPNGRINENTILLRLG